MFAQYSPPSIALVRTAQAELPVVPPALMMLLFYIRPRTDEDLVPKALSLTGCAVAVTNARKLAHTLWDLDKGNQRIDA